MGLGYEGHDQEVYAKLIFKSAATILREIGCAFFPGFDGSSEDMLLLMSSKFEATNTISF